ncbi:hypothetical protein THAOC_12505, partial [Thalassiosira oceanica]
MVASGEAVESNLASLSLIQHLRQAMGREEERRRSAKSPGPGEVSLGPRPDSVRGREAPAPPSRMRIVLDVPGPALDPSPRPSGA